MDLNALSGFIEHVGLPVAMLLAFGWWIVRKDDQEQRRADLRRQEWEGREQSRKLERKEDRDTHLAALDKIVADARQARAEDREATVEILRELTEGQKEHTHALDRIRDALNGRGGSDG